MDALQVKKINDLAKSLKENGMAVTMEQAVQKAKEIVLGKSEGEGNTANQVRSVIKDEEPSSPPVQPPVLQVSKQDALQQIDLHYSLENELLKRPHRLQLKKGR